MVRILVAEDEAPVAFDPAQRVQIVVQIVEILRVTAGSVLVHIHALAGAVIYPAVIAAHECRLVAPFNRGQHGTAMATRIDHGPYFAIRIPRYQHRLAAGPGTEIIVRIGNLALVAQVNPVGFENPFPTKLLLIIKGRHFFKQLRCSFEKQAFIGPTRAIQSTRDFLGKQLATIYENF